MKTKTMALCICAIGLTLAITGCAKRGKEVLRMGTTGEYPPFTYLQNDQLRGVDIEIGTRIAEKLGMELKIEQLPFDSLFPSLATNQIDIAMDAITITEERSKFLDFSSSYYTADQVIVAPENSAIKIAKLEELGSYKIGCQKETTGAEYVKKNLVDKGLLPSKNYQEFTTNVEALGELFGGRIDLLSIDNTAATGFAKQKPLRIVYTIPTGENYGIAMHKGKSLNPKVKKAMDEMLADGEVEAIIARNIK